MQFYKMKFFLFFLILLVSSPVCAIEKDFFEQDTSSPFYVSPVVNVVISGSDYQHVEEVLSKLVSLSKKVPVRNVILYHQGKGLENFSFQEDSNDSASLSRQDQTNRKRNTFVPYFKELRLAPVESKAGNALLDRLRISYSPTWVVRYEGKDYIYEGYPDISRMFSSKGTFTPE